jgi:hypothetical protein
MKSNVSFRLRSDLETVDTALKLTKFKNLFQTRVSLRSTI